MTRLGFAVLLLSSFLAVPCCVQAFQNDAATAPEHRFTISGNVYLGDTSHPAYNVMVQLQAEDGADRLDAATNESGGFVIYDLKPAMYTLALDVQGYERASVSVDLSFASSKGLVITLQPVESSDISHKATSVSSHELSIPKKARDLVTSGKTKLNEQHDAAGALDDFKQAMSLAPNYYEAEYEVAMAYLTQGKRDEAASSFQKSIDMSDGKYGEGFVGLGTLAADRKDYTQAEKELRQGITLSPDFWLGHYELGRTLFLEDRIDEAKASAEQARSLAPAAPIIYRLLANIHLKEKDYRAAEADIDEYVKLDPDSAAGRRAKELREVVAQKVDSQPTPPAGNAPTLQQHQ
ncbi:MAG: tetratricopeptide repeat protein [Candidatus Acidiferrales bacterium]